MSSQIKNRVFMQRRAGKKTSAASKGLRFRPYSNDRYLPWHKKEYRNSHFRVEQIFRGHLIPYFGNRLLGNVDAAAVEAYQAQRQGEAAPATLSKELRQLNASLNKAVEWGLLDRNRAQGVKLATQNEEAEEIHFYTAEQLQALYAYARKAYETPGVGSVCWAPFWRLLANTGVQRSEAVELRWKDIAQNELTVHATREGPPKRGDTRAIPISEGAREALAEIQSYTGTTPFIFPRITLPKLSARFALHTEKAGIGGSLWWLRHTFIAHLVMQGVPLTRVQQLAGQATFRSTERYAYLAPDSVAYSLDHLAL